MGPDATRIIETHAKFFANRHGLQWADRQDAMQEAYIAALRALPRFDSERGHLGPYLRTCVEFRLRVWNKRRRLHPTVDLGLPEIPERDAGASQLELLDDVRQLVRLLPRLERQHQIVLANLLCGKTHADIAKLLRVTRQRVGQLKDGLVERLRQMLPA